MGDMAAAEGTAAANLAAMNSPTIHGGGSNFNSHYLDTGNNTWKYLRRILFRWKGSIYKLMWTDLVAWLVTYYLLRVIYFYGMKDPLTKREFEKYVTYCRNVGNYVPLSFVLGFYVTTVLRRWWRTWELIPSPDNLAFYVTAYIQGSDERGRMIRRTIMRYVILGIAYSMTLFSVQVRKRFSTLDEFVKFGLLEEDEIPVIQKMAERTQKVYWLPLVWAGTMTATAKKEGRLESDVAMKTILDEIVKLRLFCAQCSSMVTVNVPLSYSQVVTWAVYGYFLICLIGQQVIEGEPDIYVPVFTILQFLVYMGWLKVAEALINPFGEDDDDFELVSLIERGLERAYAVVDELHAVHPRLVKDQYFDTVLPELTVTKERGDFEGSMPDITRTNLYTSVHDGHHHAGHKDRGKQVSPGHHQGKGSFDFKAAPTSHERRKRWRKLSMLQRALNGPTLPLLMGRSHESHTGEPATEHFSGTADEFVQGKLEEGGHDPDSGNVEPIYQLDTCEELHDASPDKTRRNRITWGKLSIPTKFTVDGSREESHSGGPTGSSMTPFDDIHEHEEERPCPDAFPRRLRVYENDSRSSTPDLEPGESTTFLSVPKTRKIGMIQSQSPTDFLAPLQESVAFSSAPVESLITKESYSMCGSAI